MPGLSLETGEAKNYVVRRDREAAPFTIQNL